ncbi:hypothetical protein GPALN_005799 [Globodera pallida]|nr:hypothetical protein GPALN_005799 [Globodera pallida]
MNLVWILSCLINFLFFFKINATDDVGKNLFDELWKNKNVGDNLNKKTAKIEPKETSLEPKSGANAHKFKRNFVEEQFDDQMLEEFQSEFSTKAIKKEQIEKVKIEDGEAILRGIKGEKTDFFDLKCNSNKSEDKKHNLEGKNEEKVENFDQKCKKYKIIRQFEKLEAKYMASNRHYTQKEYEAKIKEKLGYTILTIKRWRRKFGIYSKYEDNEKMKVVQRYHQIKGENPSLRDIDIAKMLHICARTLYSWKRKFEDKGVQMQCSDSFLNSKDSH